MTLPKNLKKRIKKNKILTYNVLKNMLKNINLETNSYAYKNLETNIIDTIDLNNFELEECPICYDVLETDTNYCITSCNHKFCFNCIAQTIRRDNKCPLCREILDKTAEPREELTNISAASLIQDSTIRTLNSYSRPIHDDIFDTNVFDTGLFDSDIFEDDTYNNISI